MALNQPRFAILLAAAMFMGGSIASAAEKVAIATPSVTAAKPIVTATPTASPSKLSVLPHGGTLIHVKNGTNRTLKFDLFVETSEEGRTGKFDKSMTIEPGQTAIWRLKPGMKVAKKEKAGQQLYRVGLTGMDELGRNHKWGVVGGDGMPGREATTTDKIEASDSLHHFDNIQIKPIGKL